MQPFYGRRMLLPQFAPVGGIDVLRTAAVRELNADGVAEVVVVNVCNTFIAILFQVSDVVVYVIVGERMAFELAHIREL